MSQVIILNGASSSGKSSIAVELQKLLSVPYMHLGIDHFISMMPANQNVLDKINLISEGFYWTTNNEGLPRISSGEYGKQVNAVFHSTVRHLAQSGINLIVDDVMDGSREQALWGEMLTGINHLYVQVQCDVAELEQREAKRSDRMKGSAREQAMRVHSGVQYDFSVNTQDKSSAYCARQIMDFICR
ncbi:AAA family ATPase [Vibrio sp. SCSIO 43136]|uniref:chloramphenicol phosphotransferase CPT family protein n=1 Tax=Vibrio sp. SCSIO 43136 TaxID=2819101 RepID=UPI0020765742|nr:AAA family ATPase [Vibrio sp. SCSIO 43136]USD66977.1 AAA family ATPase [Vibrio sp. SCSIO 43136]